MGSALPSALTVYTAESSFEAFDIVTNVRIGAATRCKRVSSALKAIATRQHGLWMHSALKTCSFVRPSSNDMVSSKVCWRLLSGIPH